MKKIGLLFILIITLSACTTTTDNRQQVTENVTKNVDINVNLQDFEELLTFIYEEVSPSVLGVQNINNGFSQGTGSGVVYKKDAAGFYYVITNAHVVEDATELKVYVGDDVYYDAELVGSDYKTDLAVLKFSSEEIIPIISIGESSLVKAGQFSIAIGNPLGFDLFRTITLGIIGYPNRVMDVDTDDDGKYDWNSQYLQTDAALSPGNSGGALLDLEGKLIGINTLKFIDRNASGLGFAIPIDYAMTVVSELEQFGEFRRPLLGITASDVKNILTDPNYNIPLGVESGVYIVDITEGSDADLAGILVGDIIIEFHGVEVEDLDGLRRAIDISNVGDTVEVVVLRNGVETIVSIELLSFR